MERWGDEINDPEYESHDLSLNHNSESENTRRSQRLEERKQRNESFHVTRSISSNLNYLFDPNLGHFTDGNLMSIPAQTKRKRRRRRRKQRDPNTPPRRRRRTRRSFKRQKVIETDEEYEAVNGSQESDFEDNNPFYFKSVPSWMTTRNSSVKANLSDSLTPQMDEECETTHNKTERVLRSRTINCEGSISKPSTISKRITRSSAASLNKDYNVLQLGF